MATHQTMTGESFFKSTHGRAKDEFLWSALLEIMYLHIIILGLDEHNSLRCDYETQFLIFIVKRFSI